MDPLSRRHILAGAGLLAATQAAAATLPDAGTPATPSAAGPALPQPVRGPDGADDPGPRNAMRDAQNPDLLAPPGTDHGNMPNLRWSFADSHMRLEPGGWARETTVRELPVSAAMAGVNMRLEPGAIREMHWHKESEWALMLEGSARVTAIDTDGRNFIADVPKGDLWYFPSGLPHSIQALGEGCEFLLVFDDGAFSEDSTFLITDWFAHIPRSVLAKNFAAPESAFADIPPKELYIFHAPVPGPIAANAIASPAGGLPNPFTFSMSAVEPRKGPKGQLRIVDSRNFKASKTIAAALVEVEPGGMRELHWHPEADEWQYYIEGAARMGVFGSESRARTFDFLAGDVGYVPRSMGHYIENTGTTPLRFLEMFRSPEYSDVSLAQWMALVPEHLIREHLRLDPHLIAALPKDKNLVVG